ncbi:hypothetical protein EG329_005058 [Mollisiaceae sp. DMI_Dod_QoI]|nr:hypothetical protein EG329_005058 [Helotiales sp. DMI_Dod_QoI]
MSEKPKYEALSYMWGSKEGQMTIVVNDRQRLIRNNLWQALKHLRYPDRQRILWADALCIDQENEKERTHQVAQMSAIYTKAWSVEIWLGLGDEEGELAAGLRFVEREERERRREHEETMRSIQLQLSYEPRPHPPPHVSRRRYENLLELPYWSRLWIVQEIVLANSIKMHLGYSECAWTAFSWLLSRDYDREIKTSNLHGISQRISPVISIFLTRHNWQKAESRSIFSLIKQHQHAECSDVRDKVFGLHSLALLCCREAVPVDYSLDIHQLFAKVLRHQFLHHSTMEEQSSLFSKPGKSDWLLRIADPTESDTAKEDGNYAQQPVRQIRGFVISKVILTAPRSSSSEAINSMTRTQGASGAPLLDQLGIEIFRKVISEEQFRGEIGKSSSTSVHVIARTLQNIHDGISLFPNLNDEMWVLENDRNPHAESVGRFNPETTGEGCMVYYSKGTQVVAAPPQTKPGDVCYIIHEVSYS